MILAAVVALSLAAPKKPNTPPPAKQRQDHTRESRRLGDRNAVAGPLFSFAPPTGVGMPDECACTAPTGSKGEALTFTRSSAAMCTKGPVSSGIDNGDLVSCAADQPRVMRGGDGTGSKGLMVEVARTNYSLRSQEMENAVWQVLGATPVVRQDHGTAPDNTATADAVHFPAVASGSRAALYQAFTGASPGACTMYLKAAPPADGGVAVAGTIEMTANSGATPCVTCSYATDTWSRCEFTGNATTYVFIGNLSGYGACASGTRNAADVYVWGVQCEAGDRASSYIPTAEASATRDEETASFTLPQSYSTSDGFSISGKFTYRGYPSTSAPSSISGPISIGADSSNRMRNTIASTGANCVYLSTGGSIAGGVTSSLTAGDGENTRRCIFTGTANGQKTLTGVTNSTTGTPATNTAATAWSWDTIKFQSEWTGTAQAAQYRRPNGVVKEVCVHNKPVACQNL